MKETTRIPAPADGEAPEGFEEMGSVGGFSDLLGPLYVQLAAFGPRFCFRVLEHHCNPFGMAHGGWLMAVMDHVIAGAGATGRDRSSGGITVNSAFDFLAPISLGDWCETEITLYEPRKRMAFVEARLHAPRSVALRCNGIVAYR